MKRRVLLRFIFTVLLLVLGLILSYAWFLNSKIYHDHVPLKFTAGDCPCIDMKIGDKTYPILLDLGSKFQMTLSKNVLDKIETQPGKMVSWVNCKSVKYYATQFILPKLSFASNTLRNVKIVEEPPDEDTVIWRDPDVKKPQGYVEPVGSVGKPFFEKFNSLLDLPKALLILSNDREALKQEGYSLDTYVQVPIEVTKKHIILEVNTKLRKVRLVLDSGSTWTLMKRSVFNSQTPSGNRYGLPYFNSDFFEIGGHDYGSHDIYFYDFPKEAEHIDGVLGVDFLMKNVIYLDFLKRIAYIKPHSMSL